MVKHVKNVRGGSGGTDAQLAVKMRVRVYPSTDAESRGVIVEDFGEMAAQPVDLGGHHSLTRPDGTVNLSNPRAIFAGSPPRFTRSRVTYEAYVVSRTSTRPQVDSAIDRQLRRDQQLSRSRGQSRDYGLEL